MFLSIKNIPKVSWSSNNAFNLKPKISTFFYLCFGLALFGLGEGLLIVSITGASPWSVLAQGISTKVNYSVGMITLFIEQKLIHGGKCVGHIEDLVVDKEFENENIAKKLIDHVINISTYNNCYKVILDCESDLVPFYEKAGFHKKAVQMRFDL